MSSVRVISKKITYCDIKSLNRFAKYSNLLNERVQTIPGFIKSESYWEYRELETSNIMKENIIYTISEWDSITEWNRWLESSSRQSIKMDYLDIIYSESFKILIKNKDRDDIFLL